MDYGFIIGVLGFVALLALIAIRVPIAYTMILVGLAGTSILSGPAIVLSQLKDLAYSAVWAASWLGRDVEWSGRRLRVSPDGRIVPLDANAGAPDAGQEPAIEPPIA